MFEVKELSFGYTDKLILKNISFKVNKGEVVSILGANGAGKTTLLSCLLNLFEPSSGEILLDSVPIGSYEQKEFCRCVAFVPQIHRPVFDYKVEEIVLMGKNPHLKGFLLPSREDRRRVDEILDELGILHLKERSYVRISGGELQLTLIARAIFQAERLIILDEPVAHLDIKNQINILKVIKKLAGKKGISALMALHDPNHAMLYSDKAILLKDGHLHSSGVSGDVITAMNMRSVYGVISKIVEFDNKKAVFSYEA